MKKTKLLLVTSFLMFTIACSKSDINKETVTSVKQTDTNKEEVFLNIKGVNVIKPSNIPKEIFNQNPFEYEEWLENNFLKSPKGRASEDKVDWSKISNKQLMNLIEKEMKNIPDLTDLKKDNIHWKNIKKDFPQLNSEADLEKYGDAISSYYSDIIKYKISLEIVNIMKSARKARPESINEGPNIIAATQWETQLSASYPIAGYSIDIARTDATSAVINIYGSIGNNDDHNSNAFKHAVWNAMGIQEMMQRLMSKTNSLDKMCQFATGHEMEVIGCESCSQKTFTGSITNKIKTYFTWNFDSYSISVQLPQHVQQAMDLHNNMAGRSYMQREASFFSRPSDNTIIQYFKGVSCISTYEKSVDEILLKHGNNWSTLAKTTYNNNVSGNLYRAPNSLDIRRKDNSITGTIICN